MHHIVALLLNPNFLLSYESDMSQTILMTLRTSANLAERLHCSEQGRPHATNSLSLTLWHAAGDAAASASGINEQSLKYGATIAQVSNWHEAVLLPAINAQVFLHLIHHELNRVVVVKTPLPRSEL